MKFKTILVDPPWPQGKTGKRVTRPNQDEHLDYPTLTIEQITNIPVASLADDNSLLFLWTTDRFLEQAHAILRNWGFKKHCTFVWNKDTGVCPFSVQFRNEYMIMGYIGKFTLKKIGLPTNFFAKATKHSQKPEASFEVVEAISYEPRVELFARQHRPGWDCWGNEVKSTIDFQLEATKDN